MVWADGDEVAKARTLMPPVFCKRGVDVVSKLVVVGSRNGTFELGELVT